ncbi:DUF4012 domain-containing protein [Paramicrobacterium fandaimingii]|uniref:DUF4012 domain-containing protein n=1 Tax=Paramicrobacterium fandaimingii TaxID=2708079 RepID=UPI0014201810|nr:DUF4012 domain-containing protein [Microbacterium fandaimingii]
MNERVRGAKKPLLRSLRFWLPVVALSLLLIVGIAGVVVASKLIPQATEAKDELQAALPLASQVQQQILDGDTEAAAETAASLREHTGAARAQTTGDLWHLAEAVPFIGNNLKAVRVVSETVDDLAVDALEPATKLSVEAVQPVDGRIDVDAIADLLPFIDSTAASINSAQKKLADVPRDALIDDVSSGITKLETALGKADTVLEQLRVPVAVLPSALGAEEPRNYLMIFQGNSEVRAAGGNPAAMVLIHVEDGAIEIAQQASSTDFENSMAREPVMELDPNVKKVYSDIIGKYIPNITSTPDFPTTAALMEAFWNEEFDTQLDGIISFDPVGLSYLLNATGPVEMPTGDTLTADNAVSLLLNEAYFRYPGGAESDAFFAAAAASVFEALTAGNGDPKAMVSALVQSANEGRLMMWSPHEDLAGAIHGTALEGVLPADNAEKTTVGVYFNDTTGSKMDYYVEAKVAAKTNQCDISSGESPTFTTDVTLTNLITREEASTLPGYITGPYYKPGDIATDFIVYGPVGASIDSWMVNGKEYSAKATGEIDGRPVVRLNYVLKPGESVTVSYTMTGAPDQEYGEFGIDTTPMVRDTPVTITGCKPEDKK